MRLFKIAIVIGMGILAGGCASDSPTSPERGPSVEKSSGSPADPLPGYVEHGNDTARTRLTFKDARILYRAALRYTADNGGRCASGPFQQNLVGRRMIDYLPGGDLLRNSFTGYRTEPQSMDRARISGQIGYEGIAADGLVIGFRITAMGATDDDYLEIEYIAPGVPGR